MPVGPFPTFDACMADGKLTEAYPDEEARRKVCGSLEAQTDASPQAEAGADASHMGGTVIEAADWWILQGNTAAREGVNDKGQLKPWADLSAPDALSSLDGAPFVWSHPAITPRNPHGFVQDRDSAPGVIVNVRARADHTVGYDVLLWKKPPAGRGVTPDDLQRNALAVDLMRAGVPIHNSPGYIYFGDDTPGMWSQHDGSKRSYGVTQHRIRFDHVAGLSPVAPGPGACPVRDGCGLGVGQDAACSCQNGAIAACCLLHGGRGAHDAATAVKALRVATGCSEVVALRAIIDASKVS